MGGGGKREGKGPGSRRRQCVRHLWTSLWGVTSRESEMVPGSLEELRAEGFTHTR